MFFGATLGMGLFGPNSPRAQSPVHIGYRFYTIVPPKIQDLLTELDRRRHCPTDVRATTLRKRL